MALTGRARIERRLAAILAADVVGYSRLMGEDEEGTLAALKAVRHELTDPTIEEHRGRIVKTMGDGLLVEFGSVVDAVLCAVEIQREMAARNQEVAASLRIVFRIGINVGDIIIDEDDIFGDGVNVAARLEALAEPGGICISQVVRDQVRGKLDVTFVDQGDKQVKNISQPVRVYRVRLSEDTPATPPDQSTRSELPVAESRNAEFDKSFLLFFRRKVLSYRFLFAIIFLCVFASVISLSVGWGFMSGTSSPNSHENPPAPKDQAAQSTLIGDPVFFEKDKVVLSGAANTVIERQAAFLKDHPSITVMVEGYSSDDEGVREGRAVLAQLRANQVRDALKERGVEGARIHTASHGATRPASAGTGESARAESRRALVIRD
jgi:class 3 adenylate cyclase